MATTRDPYEGSSLNRVFAPNSIAIIGASAREGSFGARFAQNLGDFTGTLYLINPNYKELNGRPVHPSLSALPEAPDCVLCATDLRTVEGIFEECVAAGAGGVVMIASGFAETGEAESAGVQQRIARRAAETGVRLVGPNTIGFANFQKRAAATFLTGLALDRGFDRPAADRTIGFVSQSGALGFSFGQAMHREVYFSHILTCGNSADVNLADCANYLVDDPGTRVIACVLEGMADPRQLETVTARAKAAGKPLVLYKMAKGEEGARAAASHTGNLAGSQAAYRTMVERAGGVFVDSLDDLLETACFFAKSGTPTGPGAVVIATSGGAAILCADAAEAAGVPLPQPNEAVAETLKSRIPHFGSARNPCDVTAQVINDTESFTDCVRAVLSQDDFGVLVVPHVLAYETSFPRITLLNELAGEVGKPIVLPWLAGWLEGPGAPEIEASPNLALFRSTDRCFATLAAWQRWHAHVPEAGRERVSDAGAADSVADRLHGARTLAEREAKEVLAAYGVPVVSERRATSAAEARAVAQELGRPLVMKIDSADLPHKTEVGGIALDLRTPEAVEAAFEAMMATVTERAPQARLDGVLLQPMVPHGLEIVVGARVDPAFGALVVVGLGGVLVELMKDSVAAPAPVTPRQAEAMLRRLKGARILDGFRDLPPVDVPQLADIVARVSEFAADHADRIAELDVNPLICRGADIVAVDALIVLAQEEPATAEAV